MESTHHRPSLTRFIWVSILLTVLVMLFFMLTRWLDIPSGHFIDWLIGVASFWWLLAITTIPWNLYFAARETAVEAEEAKLNLVEASILGTTEQGAERAQPAPRNRESHARSIAYVRRLARRSLIGAILLHLGSAVALYWMASGGISSVGYASAVAALLLTGLRPALRGYEYVAQRLAAIRQEIRYPREDVFTLKQSFEDLTEKVKGIERTLDINDQDSWAAKRHTAERSLRQDIDNQRSALREHTTSNQAEHRQLARDIEHAVSQISTDGKVLEHARELVRFFKNA